MQTTQAEDLGTALSRMHVLSNSIIAPERAVEMQKAQAEDYLSSLLNKSLRVTTTDTRMFLGIFKCTDSDRNIVLSQTFEYRLPPPPKPSAGKTSVTMDMTSRYLGLVVVPGEYITKIEVEEFASQMKGKTAVSGGQSSSNFI